MISPATLKICLALMLNTDSDTQQKDKELLVNDKLYETTFSQCVLSYGEDVKVIDESVNKSTTSQRVGPGGGIDQPSPSAF